MATQSKRISAIKKKLNQFKEIEKERIESKTYIH